MLGAVNNNIPYTNPHVGKTKIGQNQPVNADGKEDGISKTDPSKPLVDERDEYIHSDGASGKSPGIYRLENDENGNQKIVFDRPDSERADALADAAPEEAQSAKSPDAAPEPDVNAVPPEKPEKENTPEKPGGKKDGKWCTADTGKVDAEIKQIKNKKQQLEQQMNRIRGDEEKREDLKQQLSQVESELRKKDTDAYRRANAKFTFSDE